MKYLILILGLLAAISCKKEETNLNLNNQAPEFFEVIQSNSSTVVGEGGLNDNIIVKALKKPMHYTRMSVVKISNDGRFKTSEVFLGYCEPWYWQPEQNNYDLKWTFPRIILVQANDNTIVDGEQEGKLIIRFSYYNPTSSNPTGFDGSVEIKVTIIDDD